MLLWLVCLQLWLMLFALSRTDEPLKETTLKFLWIIQAGFSLYCLLFNNPFHRLMPFPMEGNDLNPVLQDRSLVYHPPLLYLGYTGFLLVGAFSTAMMVHKQLDLAVLRKWAMAAFGFLTLGITAGSWWAYDELGWGGFWFWDPVESLSLLPWFAGNAILHTTKRPNKWAPLWGILAGGAVALNIVLVRGGVLTSVHSFAKDPYSIVILSVLCVGLLLPALWIYCRNANIFPTCPWSSYPGWNSLLMGISYVVILIGVLGPLALELMGYRIQVAPLYYTIFMMPVALSMMIGMAYFIPKHLSFKISTWFMILGHAGYFLLFTGVMVNALWSQESQKLLAIGESLKVKHYDIQLQEIRTIDAPNKKRTQAKMVLTTFHKHRHELYPERHYYTVADQSTSQSALWRKGPSLVCVILGEQYPDKRWLVKAYYNRWILLVFCGGILIGLTALIGSLRTRRQQDNTPPENDL
jgi:cytochrome c biogenesis factor